MSTHDDIKVIAIGVAIAGVVIFAGVKLHATISYNMKQAEDKAIQANKDSGFIFQPNFPSEVKHAPPGTKLINMGWNSKEDTFEFTLEIPKKEMLKYRLSYTLIDNYTVSDFNVIKTGTFESANVSGYKTYSIPEVHTNNYKKYLAIQLYVREE